MGGLLPPAEHRSTRLLASYAGVSLVLLVTGARLPQGALRGLGATLFAPFDRVVLAADRMTSAWRENSRLHQRLAELEIENQKLRDSGAENDRLREQLGLAARSTVPLRPVEVLALAGEPIPSAATLSAGRRSGVREGDVVVTRDGLAGRVTEVYPNLSRATLLSDVNAAVACEVESTGVMGVLHWVTSPYPRLALTGVPLADTVRAGQRVITSGMSRFYPRGLTVGTIARVDREAGGLTQDIEVAAAARLSRLRHAFVLAGPPDSLGEFR
jgi:rod shape-determining protein MreC